MSRLFWAAVLAALFHVLVFMSPVPSKPQVPSASTKGSTISVSVAQAPMVTRVPDKPKPKKEEKKPEPKKKPKKPPKKVARKVKKCRRKVVEPAPQPEPEIIEANPVEVQVEEAEQQQKEVPATGGAVVSAVPTTMYAPEPVYPGAARKRGYQGTVLLEICVNGEGFVEKVRLKKSSGYGVLDRSAIKGVRKWRFSATGALASVWLVQPVTFELIGAGGI